MSKITFLPVNHGADGLDRNRWCGPAALSVVLGCSTGEAARQIRTVTGERQVTGVTTIDLLTVLRTCYDVRIRFHTMRNASPNIPVRNRPTFAAWLRHSKTMRTVGRVFLVVAGRHFQVVSGRRFCDSLTQEIVSIRDKRVGRRRRVESVFELSS